MRRVDVRFGGWARDEGYEASAAEHGAEDPIVESTPVIVDGASRSGENAAEGWVAEILPWLELGFECAS